MNIIQAIEDPKLFGSLIKDQSTWAAWKVFLRGLFALPMTDEDGETFKRHTGRTLVPTKRPEEAYAIVGRRGGKSFISALTAVYLATFMDWRPYLARGEDGWVMVIAADRQQARNIFGYIRGALTMPMFKREIEKELSEEIRLKNGIVISVKTADFRTIRGFTVVAAICDEIAYWRSEGLNPATEILHALRPGLATVPGSLLLGISSPYSKAGPLYEAFRAKYGADDSEVLVWKAPTKAMNPTLPERVIERALRDDYSVARAEWFAEFREDLETFLQTEIVEAAIIPGRFELPAISSVQYVAFVDPSGGRADSFTMAIAHREESGRIVLDRLEERRPPLAPADVAAEYAEIMKSYGVYRVTGDKYAGEWVARAFMDCDITYEASELTKSEIYLNFEPILAQGRAELLDQRTMFNELRGLERRTRSGGKDQVDHGPGCHDDVANAAAGACVLAAAEDSGPLEIIVI